LLPRSHLPEHYVIALRSPALVPSRSRRGSRRGPAGTADATRLCGLKAPLPDRFRAEIAGPEDHVADTDREHHQCDARSVANTHVGASTPSTSASPVGMPPEIRRAANVTISTAVNATYTNARMCAACQCSEIS
jgi:hypothetical protein